MKRLTEIFTRNYFYFKHMIDNCIPRTFVSIDNIIENAFRYMEENLSEKEFDEVSQYLSSMADKICPDFCSVITIDEKGRERLDLDMEDPNTSLYPYMDDVVKYIYEKMWSLIETCDKPFIHGDWLEDGFLLKDIITKSTKVVIPGYCKYVQNWALNKCNGIEELIFEEGVESIQCGLLEKNRDTLKKVVFASTVKWIGLCIFQDCKNLEEVVFNGDNTPFSYQTFENTKWFKNYKENNKDKTMFIEGGTLFYYTGDDEVLTIPDNVKNIGDFALENAEFKRINLPEELLDIGQGAFNGCENLEYIVIPDNVRTIYCCFEGCDSLREVYLHENIEVGMINETFRVSEYITVYGYRNNKSMQHLAKQQYVNFEFID